MPKYQYQCKDCGHPLEVQQSFSDDALTICPDCGGRLRKMFNAVGVVFKGSGFYKTDSRSATSSTGSTGSGSGSGDSTSSAASASDSKPAAKAESTPAAKSGSNSAA